MGIAVDFPTILAVICVLTVMMAADSKSVDSDDYSSRRSSRRYKETKGLLATEEKSEESECLCSRCLFSVFYFA